MTYSIVHTTEKNNVLSVVVDVRKYLLEEKADDLSQDDIAHHAPNIGNNNHKN